MTDEGVVFTIWQNDGTRSFLAIECAPLVDRAMKLWTVESRNTWLTVQTSEGADYSILASTITSAMLTTPAQRFAACERDKRAEDEYKENRRAVGFIESES